MRRKFGSPTAAAKVAKVLKMKVKKGTATKLTNGKKANWYTFTKKAKKKK
jgi:dTDP-4-dehydrorhamnose reductase